MSGLRQRRTTAVRAVTSILRFKKTGRNATSEQQPSKSYHETCGLPLELWLPVFAFCPPPTIASLRHVCRLFRSLARESFGNTVELFAQSQRIEYLSLLRPRTLRWLHNMDYLELQRLGWSLYVNYYDLRSVSWWPIRSAKAYYYEAVQKMVCYGGPARFSRTHLRYISGLKNLRSLTIVGWYYDDTIHQVIFQLPSLRELILTQVNTPPNHVITSITQTDTRLSSLTLRFGRYLGPWSGSPESLVGLIQALPLMHLRHFHLDIPSLPKLEDIFEALSARLLENSLETLQLFTGNVSDCALHAFLATQRSILKLIISISNEGALFRCDEVGLFPSLTSLTCFGSVPALHRAELEHLTELTCHSFYPDSSMIILDELLCAGQFSSMALRQLKLYDVPIMPRCAIRTIFQSFPSLEVFYLGLYEHSAILPQAFIHEDVGQSLSYVPRCRQLHFDGPLGELWCDFYSSDSRQRRHLLERQRRLIRTWERNCGSLRRITLDAVIWIWVGIEEWKAYRNESGTSYDIPLDLDGGEWITDHW